MRRWGRPEGGKPHEPGLARRGHCRGACGHRDRLGALSVDVLDVVQEPALRALGYAALGILADDPALFRGVPEKGVSAAGVEQRDHRLRLDDLITGARR